MQNIPIFTQHSNFTIRHKDIEYNVEKHTLVQSSVWWENLLKEDLIILIDDDWDPEYLLKYIYNQPPNLRHILDTMSISYIINKTIAALYLSSKWIISPNITNKIWTDILNFLTGYQSIGDFVTEYTKQTNTSLRILEAEDINQLLCDIISIKYILLTAYRLYEFDSVTYSIKPTVECKSNVDSTLQGKIKSQRSIHRLSTTKLSTVILPNVYLIYLRGYSVYSSSKYSEYAVYAKTKTVNSSNIEWGITLYELVEGLFHIRSFGDRSAIQKMNYEPDGNYLKIIWDSNTYMNQFEEEYMVGQ
jgi:hypothetical protein